MRSRSPACSRWNDSSASPTGWGDRMRGALRCLSGSLVAAVGPLVSDALARHGVQARVVPQGRYYIKPLTQALMDAFAR